MPAVSDDHSPPLQGRVAVVTGGARGIGREFALTLGRLGAAVGVLDVDMRSFEETGEPAPAGTVIDELAAAGIRAHGVEVDVRDASAVVTAVDSVAGVLGAPAILVTAAGGGRGARPGDPASLSSNRASEIDLEHLRWVVEVNFYGTIHAVTAVAPYMKEQRYGKIVTIGSVNGLTVRPDGSQAHYAAVKAGIVHYTKFLAADLGHYGIYANCLAPGLTITAKNEGRYVGQPDTVANVALGRLGSVDDQARALAFLVTDASSYVTGTVLDVSGGTRVCWWGAPPVRDTDGTGEPGTA